MFLWINLFEWILSHNLLKEEEKTTEEKNMQNPRWNSKPFTCKSTEDGAARFASGALVEEAAVAAMAGTEALAVVAGALRFLAPRPDGAVSEPSCVPAAVSADTSKSALGVDESCCVKAAVHASVRARDASSSPCDTQS